MQLHLGSPGLTRQLQGSCVFALDLYPTLAVAITDKLLHRPINELRMLLSTYRPGHSEDLLDVVDELYRGLVACPLSVARATLPAPNATETPIRQGVAVGRPIQQKEGDC